MPTVAACQLAFQSQVAPGDDTTFLRLLQEADTRLLEMGRWRFTRTTDTLTVTDGIITLDSDYASILGLQLNDWPTDIHAQEFEFTPDGVGSIAVGKGGTLLIDQGLNGSGQRTYKLTGYIDPTWEINALLLYAPKALTDDDDTTRCDSLAALKLASIAVSMEENNSLESSSNYFRLAYEVLDNQGQNQRGSARQVVNMQPRGRGIGRIPNLR